MGLTEQKNGKKLNEIQQLSLSEFYDLFLTSNNSHIMDALAFVEDQVYLEARTHYFPILGFITDRTIEKHLDHKLKTGSSPAFGNCPENLNVKFDEVEGFVVNELNDLQTAQAMRKAYDKYVEQLMLGNITSPAFEEPQTMTLLSISVEMYLNKMIDKSQLASHLNSYRLMGREQFLRPHNVYFEKKDLFAEIKADVFFSSTD